MLSPQHTAAAFCDQYGYCDPVFRRLLAALVRSEREAAAEAMRERCAAFLLDRARPVTEASRLRIVAALRALPLE
jgi:hypothetical protein